MRSVISLSDLSHLLRISLLPWWKFINGPFIIKENCEALVCVIISRIFQLALKVLWYLIKLVFIFQSRVCIVPYADILWDNVAFTPCLYYFVLFSMVPRF